MSCSLDCHCDLTLMSCTGSCHSSGNNLASVGKISAKLVYILIIYAGYFICAESANLFSALSVVGTKFASFALLKCQFIQLLTVISKPVSLVKRGGHHRQLSQSRCLNRSHRQHRLQMRGFQPFDRE